MVKLKPLDAIITNVQLRNSNKNKRRQPSPDANESTFKLQELGFGARIVKDLPNS